MQASGTYKLILDHHLGTSFTALDTQQEEDYQLALSNATEPIIIIWIMVSVLAVLQFKAPLYQRNLGQDRSALAMLFFASLGVVYVFVIR